MSRKETLHLAIGQRFERDYREPTAFPQYRQPSGKRTAVRIVSAILFVLLAAMVIFGVDAITGWIKSLF